MGGSAIQVADNARTDHGQKLTFGASRASSTYTMYYGGVGTKLPTPSVGIYSVTIWRLHM